MIEVTGQKSFVYPGKTIKEVYDDFSNAPRPTAAQEEFVVSIKSTEEKLKLTEGDKKIRSTSTWNYNLWLKTPADLEEFKKAVAGLEWK